MANPISPKSLTHPHVLLSSPSLPLTITLSHSTVLRATPHHRAPLLLSLGFLAQPSATTTSRHLLRPSATSSPPLRPPHAAGQPREAVPSSALFFPLEPVHPSSPSGDFAHPLHRRPPQAASPPHHRPVAAGPAAVRRRTAENRPAKALLCFSAEIRATSIHSLRPFGPPSPATTTSSLLPSFPSIIPKWFGSPPSTGAAGNGLDAAGALFSGFAVFRACSGEIRRRRRSYPAPTVPS